MWPGIQFGLWSLLYAFIAVLMNLGILRITGMPIPEWSWNFFIPAAIRGFVMTLGVILFFVGPIVSMIVVHEVSLRGTQGKALELAEQLQPRLPGL